MDFNKAEAQKLWDAAELVRRSIPLELTEPERTTEYVESRLFADDLGETVTTSLAGSTQNRITNVQLAAASIDGIILAPGEQFSYNDALGERTTERATRPREHTRAARSCRRSAEASARSLPRCTTRRFWRTFR